MMALGTCSWRCAHRTGERSLFVCPALTRRTTPTPTHDSLPQDTGNGVIRKITPAGAVSTFSGMVPNSCTVSTGGANSCDNHPSGNLVDGCVLPAFSFPLCLRSNCCGLPHG